jgi:hypothetical protein
MTLVANAVRELGLKWASLRREMKEVEAILEIQSALDELDAKLRTVLPEEYQEGYEDLQPISMGSASLKFDAANKVAWDEIWDHFCDLAMAGGPPHKGKLLEPASPAEVEAQPDRYRAVVQELCRGIRMVSTLAVEPSSNPGWIRVMCSTDVMAEWMVRAIVMENVAARLQGSVVELPASPHYRLEKEIKNVVTVIAKTFHYFDGHIGKDQQRRIAAEFASTGAPLLQPGWPADVSDLALFRLAKTTAAGQLLHLTGLPEGGAEYVGWLGLECPDVRSAIWMMRALVVNNTLARREDQFLYVPIDPILDPQGSRVSSAVARVHRLACARGICSTSR